MIQAVGYSEPSYVLTTGTQNLHPPETVVAIPEDEAELPAVYLINMEDEEGAPALSDLTSEAHTRLRGICQAQSAPHYAVNYSNGDPVNFIAVRLDLCDRASTLD